MRYVLFASLTIISAKNLAYDDLLLQVVAAISCVVGIVGFMWCLQDDLQQQKDLR